MRRSSRKPRVKVGTIVGLPDDIGIVTRALVIEDRGDLGPNGEQMVRLSLETDEGEEDVETEPVVSDLVEPPTEPVEEQWWRLTAPLRAQQRKARRARRRAATA